MNREKKNCYLWLNEETDKWYVLFLTNGKGACKIRCYNLPQGEKVKDIEETRKGNFQDKQNFLEYMTACSFPQVLDKWPNLEKEAKVKLPDYVLKNVSKNVTKLSISLLKTLDC